jgi:hypothetical protein
MLRIENRRMKLMTESKKSILIILLACLFFSVVPERGAALGSPLRKGPYLIYAGSNTQMHILWQTEATSIDTVRWGADTTGSMNADISSEYGSDHQHNFAVTGLTPGRKYFYRVLSGGAEYKGSFRAAPDSNSTHVRFFAYGDTRSHPLIHDHIAHMMDSVFLADNDYQTLVLQSGDLVIDGDNEKVWQSDFFSPELNGIQTMIRNLPYQACMGNHEKSGVLYKKYFPYPFAADRYWSFDYGPAHISVIDQFVAYDSGSAQLKWLESDLQRSKKPWKIVMFHEPGWSAGKRDSSHANNMDVQKYIEPLCEKYDVHLVICGHNHFYSRAKIITASGDSVFHITSGGGGAPLYPLDASSPNIVTATKVNHFCEVEIVSPTELHMQAISASGEVIDKFSIIRGR